MPMAFVTAFCLFAWLDQWLAMLMAATGWQWQWLAMPMGAMGWAIKGSRHKCPENHSPPMADHIE